MLEQLSYLMSLSSKNIVSLNTTTIIVLANLKKRAKSVLIVFLVVVITMYVVLIRANYFLYCVVEYISIDFAIYISIREYKDVLLQEYKVVSTGKKVYRRRFSRKEFYCREILTSKCYDLSQGAPGVSVITLKDRAAQSKDCGAAARRGHVTARPRAADART